MLLLKKHYEKVILAVLLLIFLLLLGFQIMVILRAKDIEIDTVLGVKPPKPGYPRQVDFSKPEFTEKAIFDSEKSHWISDPSKAGKNDVCQAFPIIRCPFGPHLIPVTDYPPNNSKNPGTCSYCGNEIKVLVTSLVVTEDDSDGDGIPDKEEIRWGLNPKDPKDAALDEDNDGFSNLEEYKAKTNPKDPKNRPSYAKKLYYQKIENEPLGMWLSRFGSNAMTEDDVNKWDIQIRYFRSMKRRNPRYTRVHDGKKVGETFTIGKKTYIIDKVNKDFGVNPKTKERINRSSIVVYEYDPKAKKKIGLPILAKLGEVRDNTVVEEMVDPRKRIAFYFVVDKQPLVQYVGDEFRLGDERRGEDTFIVQDADPVKKQVTLKLANGMLEYIGPLPENFQIPDERLEFRDGMPPEARDLPSFRTRNRKRR